ncbi:MAG: type II toxin-antitoxin system prevent-host-death family antitoxin [Halieaceae bacterium]|nr:type II toxin-antitoxin system prevent-host-death family antitoxin [Halieaceae bacterium]
MTSVSITDLRANLSRYIREVRKGGEIEVLDRGTPVARITSPVTGNDKAWDALIKAGVLTPGNGRACEILNKPLIKLHAGLSAAVMEDREDRV